MMEHQLNSEVLLSDCHPLIGSKLRYQKVFHSGTNQRSWTKVKMRKPKYTSNLTASTPPQHIGHIGKAARSLETQQLSISSFIPILTPPPRQQLSSTPWQLFSSEDYGFELEGFHFARMWKPKWHTKHRSGPLKKVISFACRPAEINMADICK